MQNVSIVGLQWGDEGKGKVVDFYADRFDAVARYNGGSNAGHTIVIGGKAYVFHLMPSGLLKGKRLLIGPGVVVDPEILASELQLARKEGIKPDLLVDGKCTMVSPAEKELDAKIEDLRGESALGTTRRGIGPAYAMKALRLTPRIMDIVAGGFDTKAAMAFYALLTKVPDLHAWMEESKAVVKGMVGDAGSEILAMNESGRSVMFEGAQGVLLDLVHGTYPYVTGAHTIAPYIPASFGIPSKSVGKVMGVVKAYTTRVGGGPFPTEIEGKLSEDLRTIGKEYGATTGRARRIGWLDLVALKYAVRMNGVEEIALMKIDVLAQVNDMKVCEAYSIDGRESEDFAKCLAGIDGAKPVYRQLECLKGGELSSKSGKLPRAAESLVELLEEELGAKVTLVSVGEERSATILKESR